MSCTDSILTIQDLLTEWRQLGSHTDGDGIERIAQTDEDSWLHAVLAGVGAGAISACERALGVCLPGRLRGLYRCLGGLDLFDGLFRLYGPDTTASRQLGLDLGTFVSSQGSPGWMPPGAGPFAVNAWDGSLHLFGMGRSPEEIVRCEPETGEVLERYVDALHCVGARLSRLDDLAVR